MKKRIAAIIIVCFSLLAFTMFSTLLFVDHTSIVNNFINDLKISPINIGTIRIKKFPIPYFTIDHIKKEGVVELEDLKLQFSPWSLLILKPKISLVKISNAKLYLTNKNFDIINHDRLISTIITSDIINESFDITNLNILNQYDHLVSTLINFSLLKSNPLSDKRVFKGIIDTIGQFSGSIDRKKEEVNFSLNINNDYYSFQLSEIYKDTKLTYGKGKYIIRNLANVMNQIIPDLNSSFKRFNQDEIVNINFDILPTDSLLQLNNFTINANSLSANGKIYLSKQDNITNIVELHFPTIDIRSLISDENNMNRLSNVEYGLRFIFANKLAKADILVDQIILNDNEVLKQIKFISNLEKGILVVKDFSGTIESGGKFQLSGNVTQNSVRSIFDGKIYLQHNDLNTILDIVGYDKATVKETSGPFILSSDLKCTLIDVYLRNFLLQTNDTKVTGVITTKYIGYTPHIIAILNFSLLDLNKKDYPIISPIINFTKSLTENMKSDDYLKKFIPIRTIDYLGSFDVTINEMIFADYSFGKVNLLMNMSPGNISISNFDIRKGEQYLSTSWNLVATDLKPKLNFKINDGSISVNNLLYPKSLLTLKNQLLSEFNLDKIWLSLDCMLSKLYQDDLVLNNLIFSLSNDNNLFIISNLEMDIFSGKFKGTGSILLDPYAITFVYALNSIDLAKLSHILPKGLFDLYGGASISGKLNTNGDTLEQLLYNLYMQSEFIAKNTRINNFSIDSFIEKINTKDYNSTSLQDDVKKFLSEGDTILNNLSGNIALQKGITIFNNLKFGTKYSNGSASLAINIYDFSMELNSILSFYITNITNNLNNISNNNLQVNIGVKASGTIFDPKKTADTIELKKILNSAKPATQNHEIVK